MKPRSPRSLCCLAILLLPFALPNGGAEALCATESPESVLICLVEVYENRDIDAYQELFSEDFILQFGSDPANSWGLDQELEAHRNLFSAHDIVDMSLQLNGYRVTDGDQPDTWILEDVFFLLTVTTTNTKDGEPIELTSREGAIFYVKRVTHPEVHFLIYKWISHPND